jgi:DNA polymerase-3 subunit alpha
VALTEHGNVASAPALYAAARAKRIKPIIGCEMYVVPDDYLVDGDKEVLK